MEMSICRKQSKDRLGGNQLLYPVRSSLLNLKCLRSEEARNKYPCEILLTGFTERKTA